MNRVLLIDENADNSQRLGLALAQRNLTVTRVSDVGEAIRSLRKPAFTYYIVILVMADRSRSWLTVLRDLQQAGRQTALFDVPLFLCVSRLQLGPEFQLQIERMGARYVFQG
jgi:ActR/RegA family two-component response regulator